MSASAGSGQKGAGRDGVDHKKVEEQSLLNGGPAENGMPRRRYGAEESQYT